MAFWNVIYFCFHVLTFLNYFREGNVPYTSYSQTFILRFRCSNTSIGKFCSCSNLSMPDKIHSYDNCMTLVFTSDGSNQGKGFEAKYTTADNNVTKLDPNNCRYVTCNVEIGCLWYTNELQEGIKVIIAVIKLFMTFYSNGQSSSCECHVMKL